MTVQNSATSLPTSSVACVAMLATWHAIVQTDSVVPMHETMSPEVHLNDVSAEEMQWTESTKISCQNSLVIPLATVRLVESKLVLVCTIKATSTVALEEVPSHGSVNPRALQLLGNDKKAAATTMEATIRAARLHLGLLLPVATVELPVLELPHGSKLHRQEVPDMGIKATLLQGTTRMLVVTALLLLLPD
jgi:hypothetical protein